MDTKPDTIKVSAFHKEELFASHANLYITVKGSSLVSGNEAMKKAREVSQLVEALTRFGLSPDAIHLQGVRIEAASGTLLKSSIAKGKAKAEKVATAMGVKLLGVYDFMENTYDEERPPMPFQAMETSMKSRAAMADQPSLNMDVQHSKT